jgi:hypothetical protein
MGDFTPADIPIPAFIDPLLEYIRSVIPAPLYSLLLTFLSHALAILTTFSTLVLSLSTKPWNWDAQTILPPLISLLAAYLALLSLYRTTTWMIRTSLWFVKWGIIVGVLVAGTGWIAGATKDLGFLHANGLISEFSGLVLDAINGRGRNPAGSSRSKSRSRAKAKSGPRPKPWESFERHREWKHKQSEAGAGSEKDVQKFIADIARAASRAVDKSGWWQAAKSVVGVGDQDVTDRKQASSRRKTTSKTGKSSQPR